MDICRVGSEGSNGNFIFLYIVVVVRGKKEVPEK